MPVFTVKPELDGITVRQFLRRHCHVSARLLARLKRTENGMTVNGKNLRCIDILHSGDAVVLRFPEDSSHIRPVELPLQVLYEDDALMVVHKPPFMPVHPVHQHQTDTLANAVVSYWHRRGEDYTFRAVNRLDRDTSGLVLIAKSSYAHTFLAAHTRKIYLALCEGEISGSGTIDEPIHLKEGHTIQRESGKSGVAAVTHYTCLRTEHGHTLLQLRLETGRTHQIRTHFAGIGHPLAGDDMYGGSRKWFIRQCLHCTELSFVHPFTGKTVTMTDAAEDWLAVLQKNSHE